MLGRLQPRRRPIDAVVVVGTCFSRIAATLSGDVAEGDQLGEIFRDRGLLLAEPSCDGRLARVAFALFVGMGGESAQ